MKLLLFADLHLDAPFTWAKPATAALRRQNRRTTLTRIIDLAEAEQVDAILSGGDLFEHDRIAPDTVEFLRATLGRTAIPVYLAPGNHDWYSDASPYAVTEWSANVHLFTEDRLTAVTLSDGMTLWGAAHRAPANTDGFFATFRPDRGGIHLALAHASERGFLAQQGSGKMPHAPFEAAELDAAGITHAFLGHFHAPRDAERYTYPGNPDPLDFGETGERGAVLAVVGADGSITRDAADRGHLGRARPRPDRGRCAARRRGPRPAGGGAGALGGLRTGHAHRGAGRRSRGRPRHLGGGGRAPGRSRGP